MEFGFISKTISISLFMNIKIQEINQCVQFVNFSRILLMNTLFTPSTWFKHKKFEAEKYATILKFMAKFSFWNHAFLTCKLESPNTCQIHFSNSNTQIQIWVSNVVNVSEHITSKLKTGAIFWPMDFCWDFLEGFKWTDSMKECHSGIWPPVSLIWFFGPHSPVSVNWIC